MMKRACVIGWPITQSRSPLIHGYWLKRYGLDGTYTRVPVEPHAVDQFLRGLSAAGFVGCNVTVPHKEAAFRIADLKDASARAIGAANTIWLQNGKLACANTDSYGFITNLRQQVPAWQPTRGTALVLGAGGSARAIVHALLEAGADRVAVANRSLPRAAELAAHFGPRVTAHGWDSRNRLLADAGIVVNTTTLGMAGTGNPDMDFAHAPEFCVAADLVYVPLETAFLAAARARGLATCGGLGMLLHQAVPGFEKWFGVCPEVTDELTALIVADIGGV